MILNLDPSHNNVIPTIDLNNKPIIREFFSEKAIEGGNWSILERIIQRVYMSFATIKTAVSSLLDFEILWGDNSKLEFLKAIDIGVNQANNTIKLLMLLVLLKENKATLNQELHLIQEIVSAAYQRVKSEYSEISVKLDLQDQGDPIFVDFEYTVTGIELFIEFFGEIGFSNVEIVGKEIKDHWIVIIGGTSENSAIKMLQNLLETNANLENILEFVSADCLLKFLIAHRVLTIQNIRVGWAPADNNQSPKIVIDIPSHSFTSWVE
jgi:FtsZ-binding cell division protein ZapB